MSEGKDFDEIVLGLKTGKYVLGSPKPEYAKEVALSENHIRGVYEKPKSLFEFSF